MGTVRGLGRVSHPSPKHFLDTCEGSVSTGHHRAVQGVGISAQCSIAENLKRHVPNPLKRGELNPNPFESQALSLAVFTLSTVEGRFERSISNH